MKSGKTYEGDWVDGQLASCADAIENEEQVWDHAMTAKKDKLAIHTENKKLRVLQERLLMLKENIDTYPQYIEEAQAAGLLKLHSGKKVIKRATYAKWGHTETPLNFDKEWNYEGQLNESGMATGYGVATCKRLTHTGYWIEDKFHAMGETTYTPRGSPDDQPVYRQIGEWFKGDYPYITKEDKNDGKIARRTVYESGRTGKRGKITNITTIGPSKDSRSSWKAQGTLEQAFFGDKKFIV